MYAIKHANENPGLLREVGFGFDCGTPKRVTRHNGSTRGSPISTSLSDERLLDVSEARRLKVELTAAMTTSCPDLCNLVLLHHSARPRQKPQLCLHSSPFKECAIHDSVDHTKAQLSVFLDRRRWRG
jgi:hypothetical protein